jgi:hypothetical protein
MDRTTLADKALKHWTKWRPEMVKELKAEGKLAEAIQGAALQTQRMIAELKSQGLQEHEAEEVALPLFVLLPPEANAKDSPEMQSELAQKEADYQRMMAGTV